jgi:hypothetical protein
MKLGAEEKNAIGKAWNGLLSFIGEGYKRGVIADVNESMGLNALVMTIDALVKQVIESEDCGCDDKKLPQPQPVASVQVIPKA